MNKTLILLSFVLFACSNANAQTPGNRNSLIAYQDSLVALGHQMINNPNEPERYNASYNLVKTLVKALKTPNSFSFGFDSLKTISIQTSPDKKFRIFSWHVMNNDGSYRYYGTIQMNTPNGSLKIYPLIDHSHAIKNPQDTVLTNEKWYGCQYYKIIPVTNSGAPYYVLLGWKGNTVKSTKKVIETLYFKDNKAYFGLPVFEGNQENRGKNRIVFEYNRQVSMMLNYRPKEKTIVFDHLAPPDPKMKGKYEMYGPDMSYDGFKIVNGKLKYLEDLELKNDPSEVDNLFIDPRKGTTEIQNRLK